MTIKINQNVFSMLVQRNLAKASSQLGQSLERLSSGQRINRSADDPAGNSGSVSGSVTLDLTAPGSPTVTVASPTTVDTPVWTWTSAGDGNGTFRYQLDGETAGSWAETTATTYTQPTPLVPGTYTLYVQEGDDAGNWSISGTGVVVIEAAASGGGGGGGCVPGSASSVPAVLAAFALAMVIVRHQRMTAV